MSKKVTTSKDKKNESSKPETTGKSKESAPSDPPEQTAAKAEASKEKKESKAPASKSENAVVSGKELAASLIATDPSLPKAWRESFSSKVLSAKESEIPAIRRELRTTLVAHHDKAEPIADVFQTEKKENREYHYLLGMAAGGSGFDPKVRKQLFDATLAGKREEFLNILYDAILKDRPKWAKIDEAIASVNQ